MLTPPEGLAPLPTGNPGSAPAESASTTPMTESDEIFWTFCKKQPKKERIVTIFKGNILMKPGD